MLQVELTLCSAHFLPLFPDIQDEHWDECVICLDVLTEAYADTAWLRCGHVYHVNCFRMLVAEQHSIEKRCAVCRAVVATDTCSFYGCVPAHGFLIYSNLYSFDALSGNMGLLPELHLEVRGCLSSCYG